MFQMMASMAHDPTTVRQLADIHQLFANYNRISRTVTNLPDGIRTLTESEDPHIADLIKTHVGEMTSRVENADDPGLPIESPALRSIFKDYSKVVTKIETTDKGVVVTQTSSDPSVVAELQQHASEVSDFVKQGMVALEAAMMSNMHGAATTNPLR
jgi:hypothetical protein